jgi:hypothetical protein
MSDVVLLEDTREQVRTGATGVDRDIFTGVCFVLKVVW